MRIRSDQLTFLARSFGSSAQVLVEELPFSAKALQQIGGEGVNAVHFMMSQASQWHGGASDGAFERLAFLKELHGQGNLLVAVFAGAQGRLRGQAAVSGK